MHKKHLLLKYVSLTIFVCAVSMIFLAPNLESPTLHKQKAVNNNKISTQSSLPLPTNVVAASRKEKPKTIVGEDGYTYTELEEPAGGWTYPSYGEVENAGDLMASSIPTSFDARKLAYNKYIEVKNQSPSGMCWLFSSTTVAERCYMYEQQKAGKTVTPVKFSPEQLGYFMFNHVNDPLGNTAGDSSTISGSNYHDIGGNIYMVTQALSQWKGFVPESLMPFTGSIYTSADTTNCYSKNTCILENSHIFTNTQDAKRAIMDHGAVTASYYASGILSSHNGYYIGTKNTPNHQIAIVGWDDNFPASYFNEKPKGNGAWIVQNSWGQSYGEKGYFYLSYYDGSLCELSSIDVQAPNTYKYNYFYDGNCDSTAYFFKLAGYDFINVYDVKGQEQLLKAIGPTTFSKSGAATTLGVKIWTNISDVSTFYNKKPTASFSASISCSNGYNTIKIPSTYKLILKENTKFAVGITLKDNATGIMYSQSRTVGSVAHVNAVQDWQSIYADGKEFADVTKLDPTYASISFKIKALTVNYTLADKYTPKVPATTNRINVLDNSALSDDEKSKVLNAVKKLNASYLPTDVSYVVDDYGNVTITYSDGSKDKIGYASVIKNQIRLSGATRYETSRACATEILRLRGASKFDAVILAYGENFPDALGAGLLAKEYQAPILMVRDSQETEIISYLSKYLNSGSKVFLLGGTGVIRSSFEQTLKKNYDVKRFGGADRFATNSQILNSVNNVDKVLICNSDNFPDSLSASATGLPIMIVRGALNSSQIAYVKAHKTAKYYIVGGTGAVPESVNIQLKSITGKTAVKRFAGADRFATSQMIAQYFFPTASNMVATYAYNFPDGLSGGPLCQEMGAPLLLTAPGKESIAKATYKTCKARRLFTLGGPALLSDSIVKTITS